MKIALLAGDGIGPEILAEATKILDVLRKEGLSIAEVIQAILEQIAVPR